MAASYFAIIVITVAAAKPPSPGVIIGHLTATAALSTVTKWTQLKL